MRSWPNRLRFWSTSSRYFCSLFRRISARSSLHTEKQLLARLYCQNLSTRATILLANSPSCLSTPLLPRLRSAVSRALRVSQEVRSSRWLSPCRFTFWKCSARSSSAVAALTIATRAWPPSAKREVSPSQTVSVSPSSSRSSLVLPSFDTKTVPAMMRQILSLSVRVNRPFSMFSTVAQCMREQKTALGTASKTGKLLFLRPVSLKALIVRLWASFTLTFSTSQRPSARTVFPAGASQMTSGRLRQAGGRRSSAGLPWASSTAAVPRISLQMQARVSPLLRMGWLWKTRVIAFYLELQMARETGITGKWGGRWSGITGGGGRRLQWIEASDIIDFTVGDEFLLPFAQQLAHCALIASAPELASNFMIIVSFWPLISIKAQQSHLYLSAMRRQCLA